MTTTRSSRADKNSRRRFLKVAGLGSAAMVAAGVLGSAADAAPAAIKRPVRPKPAAPERPPGIEAEVAKQKHGTSELLKTIREFELPPGSEMALVFTPAKAPKRAGGGGAR